MQVTCSPAEWRPFCIFGVCACYYPRFDAVLVPTACIPRPSLHSTFTFQTHSAKRQWHALDVEEYASERNKTMPRTLFTMPQSLPHNQSPSSEMSFPVAELLAGRWCTPRTDMTCLSPTILSPLSILAENVHDRHRTWRALFSFATTTTPALTGGRVDGDNNRALSTYSDYAGGPRRNPPGACSDGSQFPRPLPSARSSAPFSVFTALRQVQDVQVIADAGTRLAQVMARWHT